jgi:hypothetical protein
MAMKKLIVAGILGTMLMLTGTVQVAKAYETRGYHSAVRHETANRYVGHSYAARPYSGRWNTNSYWHRPAYAANSWYNHTPRYGVGVCW